MGFTKLHSDIIASSVWAEPDAIRLVWITMLAMADRDGLVLASVPGLAHLARVSLSDTEAALARFSSPDPYSRSKLDEGRRIREVAGGWVLVTHALHRERSSPELQAEKRRARNARYYEKHKGKTVTKTVSVPIPDPDQIQIRSRERSAKDLTGSGEGGATEASPTVSAELPLETPTAGEVQRPTKQVRWELEDGTPCVGPRTPHSRPRLDRESSLARRATDALRDPMAHLTHGHAETWPEVCLVVAEWRRDWPNAPRPALNGGRRNPIIRGILEAFSEGYAAQHLQIAVLGSAKSEWIRASRGRQHLEHVLKDVGAINRYIDDGVEELRRNPRLRPAGLTAVASAPVTATPVSSDGEDAPPWQLEALAGVAS